MKRKIAFFLLFNFKIKIIFLFLLFLLLIGKSSLAALVSNQKTLNQSQNNFIVKYKNKDLPEAVLFKSGNGKENTIKKYKDDINVEYAEPNFLYHAALIPSDSFFENLWYLKKIKAVSAWDIARESPQIVIAIVDTGVQIDHPDLKDNIWQNKKEIINNGIDDDKNGFIDDINGWDFVNNVAQPTPKFYPGYTRDGVLHGTIVAGIAAASGNNAAGVTGITWRAQLMSLKVLDDKGEGDTENIIKAIDYAIKNGADIINFSFVGTGYSQSLEAAIKRAYDHGLIIVAAAGNEQADGQGSSLDMAPMYPACHDGKYGENMVIGVAASDSLDQKAFFSSFGFKCVDLVAPGVGIYSTVTYAADKATADGLSFNKYYDGYWAGTSMATPMVAGTAALVAGVNPRYSRNQIIKTILLGADNINRLNPDYLGRLGAGRLNVYNPVSTAQADLKKHDNVLVISPVEKSSSTIKITDSKGNLVKEFFAYGQGFRGGVNLAAGDVDGDGQDEIITGAGPGGGPHVKIYNINGILKSQFFAYGQGFRGGVNLAAGDVDGDGQDEIITGAGPGGGPHVKIYNINGILKSQFFAYGQDFRGGVNLAAGDVDGDGQDEIITGAGPGGGPHVKIFNVKGALKSQFFAFSQKFRGGVRVATAKFNSGARSSQAQIICSPGKSGGPQIIIFTNSGQIVRQFFVYDKKFKGGVNISSSDIDNDGFDEIMTGAGPGGAPHARVYESSGELISSFYAWPENFVNGINVIGLKVLK